ncbi:MAG: membrane protein insertion efficiency factor YidD [Candidatus Babeliales bacterium]
MKPYLNRLKRWFIVVATAFYATIRRLLGPANVCIYPVTCPDYARALLTQKPLYISIPLITLRLISCNPLTAFIRRFWYKK